jgi:SAM-dependent methyltransferase
MNEYRADLAYIHDAGFGDFATGAAPGVLALLSRAGIEGGLVVDLGCGSGIWARALCEAGYGVLGVDISAAMIELARRRAPAARFVHESLLAVELPPCDAVTSLGECFNYLVDDRFDDRPGDGAKGSRALGDLFGRIHAALRPGGILVFDVVEPGQVRGPEPRRVQRQAADWAVLVEVEEAPAERLLTRRITTFRRHGELFRRDEEVHRQRLFDRSDLLPLLELAGFRARTLRRYGDFRLPRGRVAFVARRG